MCSENNASAAQDHGRWCEVPHFPPAHNPTQTLCGRLEIADCLSFGAEPPGDVCKICLAKNSGGRTVALEGWSSEGYEKQVSAARRSQPFPCSFNFRFLNCFSSLSCHISSLGIDRAHFWKTAISRSGRDLDPEVLAQLVTMVDRTTYSDEARTPKIALRQIFGRLGLRQETMQARSRLRPVIDRSSCYARWHGGCGQGVDQDLGGCSSSRSWWGSSGTIADADRSSVACLPRIADAVRD